MQGFNEDSIHDPNKVRTGILLGLTFCERPVTPEYAITLKNLLLPIGCSHVTACIKGLPIDEAREKLAETAIELKCKYIFYLDDDVVPSCMIIKRLYKILEQHPEAAVAAGIYTPRIKDQEPMVFKELGMGPHWDWKFGDLIECKGVASGAMMVRTAALANISRPWFRTVTENPRNPEQSFMVTDDLYFCNKVDEAGYKIFADGGSLCSHWDAVKYVEYKLTEFLPKDDSDGTDTQKTISGAQLGEPLPSMGANRQGAPTAAVPASGRLQDGGKAHGQAPDAQRVCEARSQVKPLIVGGG